MNCESSQLFFTEPLIPDNTYARRQEHTLDWLARSTSARATDARRFLNEHIAKMPVHTQCKFVHDLREKWHSTFFELIVARILQELGASILIEEANTDGKQPDFRAQFQDATVTVEAKTPIINGKTGEEIKNRIPLLNFIESKIPAGWHVFPWQLPNIGPMDSKKNFNLTVEQMLNVAPPSEDDTDRDLIAELPSGIIHLQLFPSKANNERLGSEAPISLIDNTQQRIVHAVTSTRRQVRNSQTPVLLAIKASGLCSEFEDFDISLFGTSFERVDNNGQSVEIGFMPDGVFCKGDSDKAPTYAGVLAFLSTGFQSCIGPVLYRHPRFAGKLPNELLQLEQRSYNAVTNEIEVELPKDPGFTDRLNFVNV